MIKSFKHKGLKDFFEKGKKTGIQPAHAARLRLILGRLNVSQLPEDMALPGLDLHLLNPKKEGYWAVTVNGNWRVTFKFSGKDVVDVNLVDYH